MYRFVCFCICLMASAACLADATIPTKDIPNAQDPAWLKRYEGSFIVSYDHRSFDAVGFPVSKLEISEPAEQDEHNNRVFRPKRTVTAEGEYTRLVYVMPEDRSTLEVMRNYNEMIEEAGGKLLYGCRDNACGGDLHGNDHGGGSQGLMEKIYPESRMKDESFTNGRCATGDTPSEQRYVVANMPDENGGQRTLAVYVFGIATDTYCKALNGRVGVLVVAIEPKARERKMVTVTSDEMAKALAADGRISLYGIYFDTNKSAVKPQSKPTLEQIAKLLKAQPKLALDVVGHTDNVGGDKYNQGLSQRRADAVVASLVEDFGIDPERLTPSGAGMTKPVAGNDDEAGRAKNRRVELVKR
jgi:outer membrane protein OmpA-like peptidoglycan-associated protein